MYVLLPGVETNPSLWSNHFIISNEVDHRVCNLNPGQNLTGQNPTEQNLSGHNPTVQNTTGHNPRK